MFLILHLICKHIKLLGGYLQNLYVIDNRNL